MKNEIIERKITAITKNENGVQGDSVSVIFNDGESAVFTDFAKTIYTQTSPGVLKKTLVEFKKDLKKHDWNIEILKKLWIEETKYGME